MTIYPEDFLRRDYYRRLDARTVLIYACFERLANGRWYILARTFYKGFYGKEFDEVGLYGELSRLKLDADTGHATMQLAVTQYEIDSPYKK